MKALSVLQRTARAHGVQTSFIDSAGKQQFASDETLKVMLDRLGVSDENGAAGVVEPVIVSWKNAKPPLRTRSAERPRRIDLIINGGRKAIPVRNFRVQERRGGGFDLELPLSDLPTGYHTLVFTVKGVQHRSMLIAAPRKIYADPQRQWGGFLPLYAAHSAGSWGAGNLSDWRELAGWIAEQGGTVAGTLPIMAAFLEHPKCEPSPYSPASRLFWNEFFIDVTAIPEFQESAAARKLAGSSGFRRRLENFRAADFIDYREQWALRRKVLELLAAEFFAGDSARRAKFEKYVRDRPQAREYAQFRAACDQSRSSWHRWKTAARSGKIQASDYGPAVENFYLYAQWITQEQVDNVLEACGKKGVKFYLDLPLGVDADGFDAWKYSKFFARNVSAGAPPDAFFTKGQDWGFAPLDPRRARELRYRYVIEYLRFQMRHTGLLRIDHVMGLHRLWWVPHGYPASAGAYVTYPADELYAILSVESHLHKTMLVGENLGTVPPEVNKSMDRHGLRRMYVIQYEQPSNGKLPEPEVKVVAGVNTHDMPTFAAHWKGLDILDRADLGLIHAKDLVKQKRERAVLRSKVTSFLRKEKLLKKGANSPSDVFEAILRFLSRSPAETVLVNLEDLWGEERSQNVPGTSTERPNWKRKARLSIEEIMKDRRIAEYLRQVDGRSTGGTA